MIYVTVNAFPLVSYALLCISFSTSLVFCISKNQHMDLVAELLVNELCELLDEIFARTQTFGDDEGGVDGTSLSLAEMRSIGEMVVKLRSENMIQNLPLDHQLRLMNVLDQHVQHAAGREVDEDEGVSIALFQNWSCSFKSLV